MSTSSSSFYCLTFLNPALPFVILELLLPRASVSNISPHPHPPVSPHWWPLPSCWNLFPSSTGLQQTSSVCLLFLWALPPSSALCCFALDPLFLPVCTLSSGYFIQPHSLKYCTFIHMWMIPKFMSSVSAYLLSCRILYLTTCLLDISICTSPCVIANVFHTEFSNPIQANLCFFQLFIISIKSTQSLEISLCSSFTVLISPCSISKLPL